MKSLILKAAVLFPVLWTGYVHAENLIDYPDSYRMLTHIKTMTIHPGHSLETPFLGIHHIYGNVKVLEGFKQGKYEDGALFVFDQLKNNTKDKASVEGERVLIGVMVKDSQRFPKTDGWGYEGFAGNSRVKRLVNDGGVSCHGCHSAKKEQDYIFSEWRD